MNIPPITDPGSYEPARGRDDPPEPPPEPVYFPDHPRQWHVGGRRFMLDLPYRYVWDQDGERYRLTIPAGYLHDGASVPRPAWSLVPPQPKDRAAPGHDYPYELGGVFDDGEFEYMDADGVWRPIRESNRVFWDRAFRVWLEMDPRGPGATKRQLVYAAVRAGGRGAWGPKPPRELPDDAPEVE